MRHASSRFTLEVYTQAKARAKRDAQRRIVEMMLPEEGLASGIRLQRGNVRLSAEGCHQAVPATICSSGRSALSCPGSDQSPQHRFQGDLSFH
jgi:hypothetical protein